MSYSFEDLEIWKRSCQLAVDVCNLLEDSKEYGIRDQMQRSALSIPSNIAEGSDRASITDFLRFLVYSKSSASELRTQLYIQLKRQKNKGIESPELKRLIEETKQLSAMIQSFINSLKAKLS